MSFIEQQIYASLDLPDVRAGHHTHAQTQGLDPVSIERHEQICNRWGQYETGTDFRRALLHLPQWLDARPPAPPSHHLVILITHQGRDASGRPGALLRHIVRLDHATYRAWGGHPFRLMREGALLQEWTPQTLFPEIGPRSSGHAIAELQAIPVERYGLLRALLQRVQSKGRLHLPTPADSVEVEKTLEQVMELVPLEQRCRLSLATFLYHNANDFLLAAVRDEDADFDASVRTLQEESSPAMPAASERGLAQLFAALQAQDWGRAAAVLEESVADASGPTSAIETERPNPVEEPPPSFDSSSTAAPAEDPFADDDFRPSYRRSTASAPARGGGTRGKFLTGLVLVLVAAAAVWWLSGRDPSRRISPDPEGETGPAANLGEMVDQEEARLGHLLASGARDFDVAEALRDGKTNLPRRLAGTLARERQGLDEDLRRAASQASDEDPVVRIAGALGAAADGAQEAASRLVTLDRLSERADAGALRESWDEETRSLRLEPAAPGEETPGAGPALAWSEGLVRSAEALGEWPTAASGPLTAAAWTAYADRLEAAREQFPDDVQAPSVLAAADRAAGAVAGWLHASEEADVRAAVRRDDDPFAFLQRDPLRAATLDLRANLGAIEDEGVRLAAPLSALRSWLDAADTARESLRGGDGAAALRALVAPCDLWADLCETEPFVSALDRWRLEAWVRVGDPQGAAGRSLRAELGQQSMPRGGEARLVAAVDLLRRVRNAPSPASPALIGEVTSGAGRLGDTVARARVDAWLGAQRRDAARLRAGFSSSYADLRAALATLADAPANDVNGAFSRVRQAMAALDDEELRQAEAQRPEQVAAVRALRAAWDRPVEYEWTRCEVQLLRQADYSGETRKVAKVEVVLSRVGGPELARAEAPTSLYAPGAGFDRVIFSPDRPVALGAGDRILAVGRDVDGGTWWWHLYAEAPAGGHVLQSLARARELRVSEDVAQRAMAAPDSPPPPDLSGSAVARVRFEFADGWWRRFASQLPVLPE